MSDTDNQIPDIAGEQLKSIIERVEQVDSEIDELKEGRKEILAEAKGNGFDVAVIRKLIALRKIDREERQEQESILELYMRALDME